MKNTVKSLVLAARYGWRCYNALAGFFAKQKIRSLLLTWMLIAMTSALSLIACNDGSGTTPPPPAHVHQWGEWVQTKAPSETEEGVETRTCTLDSTHKETRPLEKLPTNTAHVHQWGAWVQTKAPTATEDGEETRTCTLDPTHKETRAIAALNHVHDWGEWAVTTPATCTTAGEEKRTCKLNGAHYETRTINALGHNYQWTVITPASYTADGIETEVCTHDSTHTGATRIIPQGVYTATEYYQLHPWLSSQPDNTPDTPYKVAMNLTANEELYNIKIQLNSTSTSSKYVILDLSGSTFTSVLENLFYGSTTPYGCATLVGIILPDTVTSIENNAFRACTNLAIITIPNSVTSIGNNTFFNCTSLTNVTLPTNASFTSIGISAFYGCSGLASVTIPDSVTSIGPAAFDGCTNLTSVTLPTNAKFTGMRYYAFHGCTSLTSITIPNNVTYIEDNVFVGCTSLTSVTFQGTITSSNFNGSAFGISSNNGYIGDLREKYLAGGIGTYTRPNSSSTTWTKQP